MHARSRTALRLARSGAALSGLLLVALLARGVSPRRALHELEVSATGEKDPRAQGAEVWLVGIRRPDGTLLPASAMGSPAGWLERGAARVAPGGGTAPLKWKGETEGRARLEFGTHRWSGAVRVRWDGLERRLDLFDGGAGGIAHLPLPDATSPEAGRWANRAAASLSGGLPALAAFAAFLVFAWVSFPESWRLPGGVAPRTVAVAQGVFGAAWAALLAAAYFPGVLTYDSLDYLRIGLSGGFTTQHPAVVCAAVAAGFRATGSTWPVVALQVLGLATVFFGLGRLAPTPREALFVPAAFLLAPPLWAAAPVLWKDTLFVLAMLAATWALGRGRALLAGALLALATLLRLNAVAATVPLLVPLAAVAVPGAGRRLRRAAVVAGGAALLLAAPALSNAAFRAHDARIPAWLQLFDLAGIYSRRPALYATSVLATRLDESRALPLYSPMSQNFLFLEPVTTFPEGPPAPSERRFDPGWVAERHREIGAEWRRVVAANPGPYLAHRFDVLGWLLSLPPRPNHYPFAAGTMPNPWGFADRTGGAAWRLLAAAKSLAAPGPLFQGWAWTAGLLVAAGLLLSRSPRPLGAWVALSGLVFTGAYLFVAPAGDFRYLTWTVASLGAALLLRSRGTSPDGEVSSRGASLDGARSGDAASASRRS